MVVLNVPADAYTCVVGGAEILQPLAHAPDAVSPHPDFQSDLIAAGLITCRRPVTRRRHALPPVSALQPESLAPFGSTLRAALLTLAAGRRFEASTLESLIHFGHLRHRASMPTHPTIIASTAAFLTALPWIPSQGQCLKRSFALRRLLARDGIETDWVFGVRTWPLLAHCWLQIDEVLLADDLDRVRGFSPILTV